MSELPTTGSVIEHNGVRYILGDELGSGAFGVVYRVKSSGQTMAVKVTKKTLDDDATNQQFLDEVFCLKYNNHIAVPAYITSFQQAGYGYLIMQCVEGEDLNIYVQNHPINEDELLTIAETVIDALQTLCKRDPSILHYDIKPENIRIAPTGKTYLLDFGSIGIGKQRRPTTKTDGYSPPEQINLDEVDERGVIYALGATLFDMLSDQGLPDAATRHTDSTDVQKILLASGVTEVVTQLIARMMHPEKTQRYQSFSKLSTEISNVRRQLPKAPRQPISAKQLGKTRIPTAPIALPSFQSAQRHWGPLAGLATALLVISIGVLLLWQAFVPATSERAHVNLSPVGSSSLPPEQTSAVTNPPLSIATTMVAITTTVSLSPIIPTETPVPPTATPTETPVPPTATPTETPVPPTAEPTETPVPPTAEPLPPDIPEPPTPEPLPPDTPEPPTPEPLQPQEPPTKVLPTRVPRVTPTRVPPRIPTLPTPVPTNSSGPDD